MTISGHWVGLALWKAGSALPLTLAVVLKSHAKGDLLQDIFSMSSRHKILRQYAVMHSKSCQNAGTWGILHIKKIKYRSKRNGRHAELLVSTRSHYLVYVSGKQHQVGLSAVLAHHTRRADSKTHFSVYIYWLGKPGNAQIGLNGQQSIFYSFSFLLQWKLFIFWDSEAMHVYTELSPMIDNGAYSHRKMDRFVASNDYLKHAYLAGRL